MKERCSGITQSERSLQNIFYHSFTAPILHMRLYTNRYRSAKIFLRYSLLFAISFLGSCGSDEKQESGTSFYIPENLDRRAQLRFEQYAVQGRLLYKQHCVNCHQDDGSGLGKLIPPLAQSDFLLNNPEKAVCIIRLGMDGPIMVNGVEYNQPMPANPQLKDIEIAEIATYILNAWGNKEGFVPVQQAQEWLKECESAE